MALSSGLCFFLLCLIFLLLFFLPFQERDSLSRQSDLSGPLLYFAGQTYEYPLVDGVKTSRKSTPFDEINYPDIDIASLSDLA